MVKGVDRDNLLSTAQLSLILAPDPSRNDCTNISRSGFGQPCVLPYERIVSPVLRAERLDRY